MVKTFRILENIHILVPRRNDIVGLSNCIKKCEGARGTLLNCPIPTSAEELNILINKKRNLSIELHHLGVIEDMCCRHKFRI